MTELIEWHEWQKTGYEKLKDKTWSCSLLWPLSSKNTPLNYQMQKL
jgi:hypothetical protein